MKVTDFTLALPQEICAELGRRVRTRRIALNLSAEELAKRANLSEPTLRKLETTGQCRLETFISTLEALNATSDLQSVLAAAARSIGEMREKAAAKPRQRAYRRTKAAAQ